MSWTVTRLSDRSFVTVGHRLWNISPYLLRLVTSIEGTFVISRLQCL